MFAVLFSWSVQADSLYPTLVLSYSAGETTLTKDMQGRVRSFVHKARAKGHIDEIAVATFADRVLTPENNLGPRDRDLAEHRAENLRAYLNKVLKVSDVDTYNMAKRANVLSRLFDTDEARVKNPKPDMPRDVGLIQVRELGKPSSAVLVIEYAEQS